MRSTTLIILFLFSAICAQAQIGVFTSTFDDLYLSKADTFYVNYTSSGNDVGFTSGQVHFPCVYDTSYGGYWSYGFSYSNMTDSVTSGYTNQYAAKTATGYNNSTQYAVAYGQYNSAKVPNTTNLGPTPGFYVTNSTYAYNSMKNGDAFAKKFGGATGTDPDWFKLTVYGYHNGVRAADSIDTYLADFRSSNAANHFILKTWQLVNLTPLGTVDSFSFVLNSSDTGSFGMNTPAYFCIDNFTIQRLEGVAQVNAPIAKVYPNPATNSLHVSINDNTVQQLTVIDLSGKIVNTIQVTGPEMAINTSSFASGTYILQFFGNNKTASVRFVKQ